MDEEMAMAKRRSRSKRLTEMEAVARKLRHLSGNLPSFL